MHVIVKTSQLDVGINSNSSVKAFSTGMLFVSWNVTCSSVVLSDALRIILENVHVHGVESSECF